MDSDEIRKLMEFLAQRVGADIKAAIQGAVLGKKAHVATSAAMGTSPVRNMTSPNGDTIQEAAVWFDLPDAEKTAANAAWLPIKRGVTVASGDVIRIVRDHPDSGDWLVDAKL